MNILEIDSENTWRGGQQQILYLTQGLKEKGHNVFLICPLKSALAKRAKEVGIDVIPIKMKGEWDIFSVNKIRKIIEENKIQICHLHSSTAHSLGIIATRKIPECKTVLTRRVISCVRKNLFSSWKYKKLNRIIAISDSVKKALLESGVNPDKIDVVYSGCDWQRFQNINGGYLFKKLKIENETPRVGIISALTKEKNHLTFVQSARILLEKFGPAQFLIVGEGKEKPKIEKLIKKLNLEKNIKLLGFRNDIPQILSIFNVFVLCSSQEGLGSSILDALASHLPVVATKVGGIPEIIKDGQNGFLVEPQQSTILAEKIAFLLKNKARAKQMAENGFHLVKEKFSVENMVEGTLKVYEQTFK